MDKTFKLNALHPDVARDKFKYGSVEAAGFDLPVYLPKGDAVILAHGFRTMPTGIAMQIPVGFEVQIRSRSGLAAKQGIFVLNSPGTIDSDYRGEIKIILANYSSTDHIIKHGDRIAQAVLSEVVRPMPEDELDNSLQWTDKLEETERGEGGLGSTGKWAIKCPSKRLFVSSKRNS